MLWALRADGDDPVSGLVREDATLEETVAVMELAEHVSHDAGRTFLDLGANIGVFSIPFAHGGWRVYAAEAGGRNCGALRISQRLNDLPVEVLPYVFHERTGKMYFLQNGPWGLVASPYGEDDHYEELQSFCLDDIEQAAGHPVERIDFVKMDIEGSEAAVIRGASHFLERYGYPPFFVRRIGLICCCRGIASKACARRSITTAIRHMCYLTAGCIPHQIQRTISKLS